MSPAAEQQRAQGDEESLTVSVEYAMARLKVKRTKVFALLRDGYLIRARKLGRETCITKSSVVDVERRAVARPIREPGLPRRSRRKPTLEEIRPQE